MIGQTGDHCRCSRQPSIILVLYTKCSYRPTKVIVIHRKIGHNIMYIPVFGKIVTFSNFPGIAIAIGSIVPFDKSCVNHLANRRCLYRSLDIGFTAKYSSQINLNHSAFTPATYNLHNLQAIRNYVLWRSSGSWFSLLSCDRPSSFSKEYFISIEGLPLDLNTSHNVRAIKIIASTPNTAIKIVKKNVKKSMASKSNVVAAIGARRRPNHVRGTMCTTFFLTRGFVERCFITKFTREKGDAIYVTHQPTPDCNGR